MATPSEGQEVTVEAAIVESRVLGIRRPSTQFLAVTIARPPGFVFGTGQVIELGTATGERGYFAISSAPIVASLDVLIKASDPRSSFEDLEEMAVVTIAGPWGLGYGVATEPYLWLLGIGSAYSALRAATLTALSAGRRPETIHFMLGVRFFADIPDLAELREWARAGIKVSLALSGGVEGCLGAAADAGWWAVSGRLAALIANVPSEVAQSAAIRIAGSEVAEDTIVAALLARGVSEGMIQRNYHADVRVTA